MSAFGTKQTYSMRSRMSAFGGKADIDQPLLTNLDLRVYGLPRRIVSGAKRSDRSLDDSLRAMLIKKPTLSEQALALRHVTLGDGERLPPTPRLGHTS